MENFLRHVIEKDLMKILHLTTNPNGGAGIAVQRVSDALSRLSVDGLSVETCFKKELQAGKLSCRIKRRILHFLFSHSRTANPIFRSCGIFSAGMADEINNSDVDIVHLHWINQDFLSICDIAKIKKPLVWTLHDSWVVCGTEHYQDIIHNDQRWRDGYLKCSFPETSSGIDLDRWIWLWKKHCWKNLKVTFTAPSSWESSILTESALFKGVPCHTIPNCIDTDIFRPEDKNQAKTALGIDNNRKIILFGADYQNNPIKGVHFLIEALQKLRDKDNLLLLCFGHNFDFKQFENTGIPVLNLGSRSGDKNLAEIYQAADVFVCPSIIDNLPNTCVEASACGVPVAAFNIGGIPDIVTHKETGYLAEPYSTDDLAEGIFYCLHNSNELGSKAREYAAARFNYESVAKQFEALYEKILDVEKFT